MCASFSGVSRDTVHKSKHACKFLGSLTRLEPTAIVGVLWNVCEGTSVGTGGRATVPTFLCGTDQGVQHVCASCLDLCTTTNRDCESQCHEKVNAFKCARRTATHRDLVSVIPEKKEKKKTKKRKEKNENLLEDFGFDFQRCAFPLPPCVFGTCALLDIVSMQYACLVCSQLTV